MIYLIFAFITFLTTWHNAKVIKDVNGTDQYWHITQLYQQIGIYLSLGFVLLIYGIHWKTVLIGYGIPLISWALMYMLLFNSLLNAMRKLELTHLGRYDKLSFGWTVVLFLIGFTIMIYTFF